MTLLAIRLINFMSLRDSGWIYLNSCNVVYGQNSSGKSVLTRALRLLRQSLNNDDPESPFTFYKKDESCVNLGNFHEILHKDDVVVADKFGLFFRCKIRESLISSEGESIERQELTRRLFVKKAPSVINLVDDTDIDSLDSPTIADRPDNYIDVDLKIEYAWNPHRQKVEIVYLSIVKELEDDTKVIFKVETLDFFDDISKNQLIPFSDIFTPREYLSVLWQYANFNLGRSFIPQLSVHTDVLGKNQSSSFDLVYQTINSILLSFRTIISEYLLNVIHIQPLRPAPQHLYILSNAQKKEWLDQGLGWFVRLLDNNINFAERELIKKWLINLELGKNLEVYQHSPNPENFLISELKIEDFSSEQYINIENIGFGASQVLPIILACLFSAPKSLLIIEQPELHLHPEAQSVLADFIFEQVMDGKRFIIETHSEHILLRIQKRIAEDTLNHRYDRSNNAEKFSLIFVHKFRGNSLVETISIKPNGDLNSPSQRFSEFFRRDYKDVMELLRLQAKLEDYE